MKKKMNSDRKKKWSVTVKKMKWQESRSLAKLRVVQARSPNYVQFSRQKTKTKNPFKILQDIPQRPRKSQVIPMRFPKEENQEKSEPSPWVKEEWNLQNCPFKHQKLQKCHLVSQEN